MKSKTGCIALLVVMGCRLAEAGEPVIPKRIVPEGKYYVVTIPQGSNTLWIGYRDKGPVTMAHLVEAGGGSKEFDRVQLTLKDKRISGKLDDLMIDGVVKGRTFEGKTPGEVRSYNDLNKANAVGKDKTWPMWSLPTAEADLKAGRLVWVSEAPTFDFSGSSSPIVAEEKLFLNRTVGYDDEVICLDARTGHLLWRQVFPNAASKIPVARNLTGCYHEGKVYMIGFSGRLYGLEVKTGSLIWQTDLGVAHNEVERRKTHSVGNKANCFLAVAEGVLFVNHLRGGTHAYDAASGRHLWTAPGVPTRWVDEDREFILCHQALRVACHDPKTGDVLWTSEGVRSGRNVVLERKANKITLVNEPENLVSNPSIDGRVFVRGLFRIYCYDLRTQKK